jgi:hypothetical protein
MFLRVLLGVDCPSSWRRSTALLCLFILVGAASMSASSLHAGLALEAKRKEIYTYQAPWLIYGMNWSVRPDQKFRLAIGSFEEECVLYLCPRARRALSLSRARQLSAAA